MPPGARPPRRNPGHPHAPPAPTAGGSDPQSALSCATPCRRSCPVAAAREASSLFGRSSRCSRSMTGGGAMSLQDSRGGSASRRNAPGSGGARTEGARARCRAGERSRADHAFPRDDRPKGLGRNALEANVLSAGPRRHTASQPRNDFPWPPRLRSAAEPGAEEGTRTPTSLRPLAPQASVSTYSTTSAGQIRSLHGGRCPPSACVPTPGHEERDTRRRPTLPPRCQGSTIGAGGLNCCVRDGNRCFPTAMITEYPFSSKESTSLR
jgi:hypothetical protein